MRQWIPEQDVSSPCQVFLAEFLSAEISRCHQRLTHLSSMNSSADTSDGLPALQPLEPFRLLEGS